MPSWGAERDGRPLGPNPLSPPRLVQPLVRRGSPRRNDGHGGDDPSPEPPTGPDAAAARPVRTPAPSDDMDSHLSGLLAGTGHTRESACERERATRSRGDQRRDAREGRGRALDATRMPASSVPPSASPLLPHPCAGKASIIGSPPSLSFFPCSRPSFCDLVSTALIRCDELYSLFAECSGVEMFKKIRAGRHICICETTDLVCMH